MQLSRNLFGLIYVYAQDNRVKYLLGMRGYVRGVAPFKPVSPGFQTFLGIFFMRIFSYFI